MGKNLSHSVMMEITGMEMDVQEIAKSKSGIFAEEDPLILLIAVSIIILRM